jgi:hypothetical protein
MMHPYPRYSTIQQCYVWKIGCISPMKCNMGYVLMHTYTYPIFLCNNKKKSHIKLSCALTLTGHTPGLGVSDLAGTSQHTRRVFRGTMIVCQHKLDDTV